MTELEENEPLLIRVTQGGVQCLILRVCFMLLPERPTSQIDTVNSLSASARTAESKELAKTVTEPHEVNFPSKYGLM
jgi:hypothetical protein